MNCAKPNSGWKRERLAWGWIFLPLAEARQGWLARAGKTWEWLAEIEDWGEKSSC